MEGSDIHVDVTSRLPEDWFSRNMLPGALHKLFKKMVLRNVKKKKKLPLSPDSPDLNLIEHLWDVQQI